MPSPGPEKFHWVNFGQSQAHSSSAGRHWGATSLGHSVWQSPGRCGSWGDRRADAGWGPRWADKGGEQRDGTGGG